MNYKIRRLSPFAHKIFGQCMDVVCCSERESVIHFILPNDEYYLSPIRFAYNLKAFWKPNLNDYTFDFITELFDFPKLSQYDTPKGFLHKGFYLEPTAPFKFMIRGASKVIDEYYSHIHWELDVFNCPRRKADFELCLIRASQVNSERLRPNSDINEPYHKTVRFLFPLIENLLTPILQTKEENKIWEADPLLFSFDKYTKIINDDFDFPEYGQLPVLVYHTLMPDIRIL